MDLPLTQNLLKTIRNNRWQDDFTEQTKIGRGGFSSVYKAKNCFDDQFYAVKKVKLRVRELKTKFEREIKRVFDEAKFLAQVNHPNILRYYNSWLEANTKPKRERFIYQSPPSFKGQFRFNELRKSEGQSTIFVRKQSEEEKIYFDNKESDDSAVIFEKPDEEEDNQNSNGSFKDIRKSKRSQTAIFKQIPNDWNKKSTKKTPSPNKNKSSKNKDENVLTEWENLESITLFIQTELCSETLEDYLQERNRILQRYSNIDAEKYIKLKKEYVKEVVSYAKQILDGLLHIHSHSIIHRDLKPSNIFMTNKTCKIGDFGLIKKLCSFSPQAASPASPVLEYAQRKSVQLKFDEMDEYEFKLETSDNEFEMLEEFQKLSFQKNFSEPLIIENNQEIILEIDSPITKSVGTKIFASPEQWQADQTKFDQRADIFSLGLIFLLMFYPTSTHMEQVEIIEDSKQGKIPKNLEKELPQIAKIIQRMLSVNPTDRPTLDVISQSLNSCRLLSEEEISGIIYTKKESANSWRQKYFKLVGDKLYIFKKQEDEKAEHIYELSEWEVQKGIEMAQNSQESYILESTITIQSPMRLGCSLKRETPDQTVKLFEKLCKGA